MPPTLPASLDDMQPTSVTVVGHSFGGVVAALVASGWFGPQVHDVAAIGVKIEWTTEETSKSLTLSQRPSRPFATREEAIARYLRTSGLSGLAEASSETALAGVIDAGDGFHVAVDPGVYGAVGPAVADLLRLARPPIRLAAGSLDPMVTLDQMRRIDRDAITFAGIGHNAHWEAPEAVWRFLSEVTHQRQQA